MTKKSKDDKPKKTKKKPTKKLLKTKGQGDGKHINEEELSKPMSAALKAVEQMAVTKITKQRTVIDLLSRDNGASIEELMTVTNWQKHTVRGFISNLKKKPDFTVTSKKERDERRYFIRPLNS